MLLSLYLVDAICIKRIIATFFGQTIVDEHNAHVKDATHALIKFLAIFDKQI